MTLSLRRLRIRSCLISLALMGLSPAANAQDFDSVLSRALNTVQSLTSSLQGVSTTTTLIVNDIRTQVGSPRPDAIGTPTVPIMPDMPGLARAVPLTPRVPPVPGVEGVPPVPRVTPISRSSHLGQTLQSGTADQLVDTMASIEPLVAGQMDQPLDLLTAPVAQTALD
ncbi:hypothetical protein [Roseicyclus amphidinii]|uniref:hypothetical protein n=1 Tax=Roseicyclus amphidinii TaxID=3034232 RepID=UPI0024E15107|nr:hypothetical protein [Roseicyclus sp. Amp-Y-6]